MDSSDIVFLVAIISKNKPLERMDHRSRYLTKTRPQMIMMREGTGPFAQKNYHNCS